MSIEFTTIGDVVTLVMGRSAWPCYGLQLHRGKDLMQSVVSTQPLMHHISHMVRPAVAEQDLALWRLTHIMIPWPIMTDRYPLYDAPWPLASWEWHVE